MRWYSFTEGIRRVLSGMGNVSKVKLTAVITSVAVAAGSIGAGGYIIYDYENLPEEIPAVQVVAVTEPVEESMLEEPEEEPVVEEEVEEEEPEKEVKELSITATSIEKDLKIKVQDPKGKLVTGELFKASVKSEKKGAKESVYEDKDKDGIIYIDKIEAGKYTVTLQEIEGYILKKESITVEVKDKIEYKKVDVSDEIKTESQINTAVEDTAVNNIPVEGTISDTLKLLESTVSASGVSKGDVDISGFSNAFAGNGVSLQNVKKTVVQEVAVPEPEKPDDDKKPEEDNKDINLDDSKEPEENTDENESQEEIQEQPVPKAAPVSVASTVITAAEASVSIPDSVTLYHCGNESSNSYTISIAVSGDESIIQSQNIQWSCDESIVSLSANTGSSVRLTEKAKGDAVLKAEVPYDSGKDGVQTVTISCTVSVQDLPGLSEVLKDKAGNVLYVDSEAKTIATLNDYLSQDTFYTAPLYTGWQTIDGKVYYYNENHQAVTGNQVIGGVSYAFAEDGSLAQSAGNWGIDVSKYQGDIDWGAVAASGINFAIIRVGYRGSSTGVLVEDPYFKKNIAGATKAGVKVGVYFFTQAITEAEAVEEASMAMSLVSGYRLTYPIFIDTESASNGRANGLSTSSRTAIVKAFCQTVQNGGYKAGVYASKSWFNNQLTASSLGNYCIWVAQYNASCTYSGKKDMWQYSSTGSVSGIKGNVDMNISYTGY